MKMLVYLWYHSFNLFYANNKQYFLKEPKSDSKKEECKVLIQEKLNFQKSYWRRPNEK